MNEYKAAWYAQTMVGQQELPPKMQMQRTEKRTAQNAQYMGVARGMAKQMGQSAALGTLYAVGVHAAQSQMKGRLGVTLRVGGRIGLRVIPVVGMALLAYDMYQFGKWVSQEI